MKINIKDTEKVTAGFQAAEDRATARTLTASTVTDTKTTLTLEDIRSMLQSKSDDLRLFSTATDALDTSVEGVWAGVILDVDDPAALARRIIVGRDVDYSDYPPLALTDDPDKHVDWDVIMDGVQAALENLLALDVAALDAMTDNHGWITIPA